MNSEMQKERVRKALQAIPDFSGAEVISRLSDGPTNQSYLLEQSGQRYVLRMDKAEARAIGLDRYAEQRAWGVAAAAGLAPGFIHFDPAAGVCLRPYLTGRAWVASDLADSARLETLAGVLRKLHKLPRLGSAFDPMAAARRYAARLGTAQAQSILEDAGSIVDGLSENSPLPTLCHNDLVCQNLLDSEGLVLIDWEYAGIGNPYFDLAVVVRHHGLDDNAAQHFLDAYFGRAASLQEINRLDLQCEFYGCLLNLWELMHPRS